MKRVTERRTYSYLGPAGTFTEAALEQVAEARGQDWRAVHNVGEALADVLEGRSDAAMIACLLYTSPSPRDLSTSRMPSSA